MVQADISLDGRVCQTPLRLHMSENVHKRFSDHNGDKLSQLGSHKAYTHISQARKRSAGEAFQKDMSERTGVPKSQAFVSSTGEQPALGKDPDDRTKGHTRGRKTSFGSPDLRPSQAKRSQLKARAQELLCLRKTLPITPHADEIRAKLRNHDVLLLVGETGSGKSTQVPQFLINEPWCQARTVSIPPAHDGLGSARYDEQTATARIKVGGCIAITQPRRLAAISLASRVAAELGTPLGSSSPSSQVGYSVRFDTSVSPSTRIKFLTEGMLLQEMLRDPYLREYSAVIVDEVHERGMNVDLVLGFLRRMVSEKKHLDGRGGVGIKVVVMSATADMEVVEDYFSQSSFGNNSRQINGDPVIANSLNGHHDQGGEVDYGVSDSDDSWPGLSPLSPIRDDPMPKKSPQSPATDGIATKSINSLITSCHIKGRQYPVRIIYTPSPVQDLLDSALHTILHIHTHEPLPGDILVFLTGQEIVENLASLCHEALLSLTQDPKARSTIPKLLILPLFAALPQHAQQRVFEKTPPRTRKVILSTNIAETSLTVPGIRYVIDSGKCKKKQFRSRLGLDSLLVKPISKSAANQRKGRAGREAPGTCYRLYTEKDYLMLEQDNDPEVLRCDLSQMVLSLKARGVDDVVNFPLLTAPPREALERALVHLLQLQALDPSTGRITDLGTSIAKLPLTAALGRVLLAAAQPQHNCVAESIDIIAALSVENLFLSTGTEERKEEAETARRDLYRREGDHLTLLAAVAAYAAENSDRRAWCEKRFISHRAMQAVMDVRKQLLAQSKTVISSRPPSDSTTTTGSGSGNAIDLPARLLKAFLAGFLTKTARLMPDGSYRTMVGNQTVAIHPSSVLFGRKCEAIMYNEFVFTQRSYARTVSAVQMDWVDEMMLGLNVGCAAA